MTRPTVAIQQLPHARDLPLPAYATDGSAGMDLLAAVDGDLPLQPGERTLVPTGLAIALPAGYEAQIRPRSGLALKHGVTVLNAPGTIDADYRGELGVILINHGARSFTVERGSRIAQLIIAPYARGEWAASSELPASERGTGGFGSTGFEATPKTAANT